MWLLLVTTLTSAVLSDAWYLYNPPNVPASFVHNQPSNIPVSNPQPHHANIVSSSGNDDKSITYSISYKDCIYLKNLHNLGSISNNEVHGNIGHSSGNEGILATQNIQNNIGHLFNGNVRYGAPVTGPINYNNNAPSYILPTINAQTIQHNHNPVTNVATNIGYPQSSFTPHSASYNYHNAPTSSGYSQSALSTGTVLNSGSPNNLISSTFFVSPQGNNQKVSSLTSAGSASSTSTNLNQSYGPPLSGYELNNALLGTSSATGSLSTGYSQTAKESTSIDLNSGFPQLLPSLEPFDNSFRQSFTSGTDSLSNGLSSLVNAALAPSKDIPPVSSGVKRIQKHIYFHVPPPEFEEVQKVNALPVLPRKNYKIIFIKVPSQDPRTTILPRNPLEDKTLIYVLSKDQEQLNLPKSKPSEHKVFYVNYNGSPFDIASQVNNELEKTGLFKDNIALEPGLLNGRHKRNVF